MTGSLPNFLIVGAMRSGTTALARYMGAHPDVYIAPEKEVHFFDRHFGRGVEWYSGRFAAATDEVAVGEATQSYMYDTQSVELMARTIPTAKLIAILRDPIDRAYSHYQLNRSLGIEPLTFRDAVDAEPERLATGDRAQRFAYSYIDRGRYFAQLSRLCDHFPRESIHVVLFEDMARDVGSEFRSVCRFVGVDDRVLPDLLGHPINRHVEFRSKRLHRIGKRLPTPLRRGLGRINARSVRYAPLDAATRLALRPLVIEDVNAISGWLGRDPSDWSTWVGNRDAKSPHARTGQAIDTHER